MLIKWNRFQPLGFRITFPLQCLNLFKIFTMAILNVHFIGSYSISIVNDGMFRLLFIIPLLSQVGVNESQQFCKLVQNQNITWLIINIGGWLTSVRSSFRKPQSFSIYPDPRSWSRSEESWKSLTCYFVFKHANTREYCSRTSEGKWDSRACKRSCVYACFARWTISERNKKQLVLKGFCRSTARLESPTCYN